MDKKKLLSFLLFLLSSVLILTTCGGGGERGGGGVGPAPATLSSIAVTPANPSLPVGSTRQFAATGTYSDGTSQDITTQVTWSSSAGNIATVSNVAGSQGLATGGPSVGTTTISASLGTVSGSTILTVVQPPPEFLYAASWSSSNISVYTINLTTGALTAVGTPVAPGGHPTWIITSRLIQ